MKNFRKIIKSKGKKILSCFNFNLPRKLNGNRITIPVTSGIKVGISGEKWLSEIIKILFQNYKGTFLDIGVNLGQTLVKVKSIDAKQNYIGFEPNPSCMFYLQRLVKVNNWNNDNTLLIPAGLFTFDCILNLYGKTDTDGCSTIINELQIRNKHDENTISKYVPVFTFSTLQKYIPDKTISVVKIDVEGAEVEVIESLKIIIKRDKPILIIEIWDHKNDTFLKRRLGILARTIKKLNYVIFSWNTLKDKPYYCHFKETVIGSSSSENYVLAPLEKKEKILKILAN